MQEFAEQCLDIARSILAQNISAIQEDGTVGPIEGEHVRFDESGHAALAIGEFFRATGETSLEGRDLIDLGARAITAQAFSEQESENGLAYAALGLLSFGPSKERNAVWERLLDPTRETLDKRLLMRSDYQDHRQAFNIAKSVARYSMGLSKKDETGKLIDSFIERLKERSSQGYHDDSTGNGYGGVFDVYGVLSFIFIRQALQLHANLQLRDRKLPTLRTSAEKYLKMMPDIVRQDGLGWAFGRSIGAYGQMHCISLIMQTMRDEWIAPDQRPVYYDILRRLFQFFFVTYVDQEHGYIVIRDAERSTGPNHTTRLANFDAARYLCQWSRLAKSIQTDPPKAKPAPTRPVGRFIAFDKSSRKEQGIFNYLDPESGLHFQLPIISQDGAEASDGLAFPHCPGIFDWPVDKYLPVMLPELTFGENVVIPSFYGKRIVTGLGLRNSFYLRFEQPDLITREEKTVPGLGSCKVSWSFLKNRVESEFLFMVKNSVTLDRFRYLFVIGRPHSGYRLGNTLALGPEGLRCNVLHDDFQGSWQQTDVVTDEPDYTTYWGNLDFVQVLERDHALNMRPGMQYRFRVVFEPDVSMADA